MLPLRAVEDALGITRSRVLKMIRAGQIATEKKWLPGEPPQHYLSREELERLKRERAEKLTGEKRGVGRPPKAPKDLS